MEMRPSPTFRCPSRWLPDSFFASFKCSQGDRIPDGSGQLGGDRRSPVLRRQVVASDERVGRVHADPNPGAPGDLPERIEGGTELGAGPDGVLDHGLGHPGSTVEFCRLLPGAPETVHEPVHAYLFAITAVTARVHDHQIDAQGARRDQLVGESPHRAVPQLLVLRCQVYEVLGVRDDRRDPELAGAFNQNVGVPAWHGVGPALGVGDEDLDRLAPQFARGLQGLREPARGR